MTEREKEAEEFYGESGLIKKILPEILKREADLHGLNEIVEECYEEMDVSPATARAFIGGLMRGMGNTYLPSLEQLKEEHFEFWASNRLRMMSVLLGTLEIPEDSEAVRRLRNYYGDKFAYPIKSS